MAENFVIKHADPIPVPEFETLLEYLLVKAKEHAANGKSHYAIDAITKEKRYFANFEEETRRIASALFKLGLKKNGYVIYMPSQVIRLSIFIAGVWRANGVCRASYADDEPSILTSRIIESDCSIILCDPNRVEACEAAIKDIGHPVKIITTEKCDGYLSIEDILNNDDGESCPALEVKADDPAITLNTSGTTGAPKGAVLTHGLLLQHLYYYSLFPFTEHKPNLMFSTATHYSGSLFIFSLLMSGKTGIQSGKISKEILWEAVDAFKPGLVFAFNTYLLTMVSPEAKEKGYDFSSIEYLMTGGAMVTPAIKKAVLEIPNVKDLIIIYGLSENGVVVTNAIIPPPTDSEQLTYSNLPDFAVGKPCPAVAIQIRDTETLKPLGPLERGEIVIKYCGNFHSYFKNPEATNNSYIDGYLRTGDVGYYDEQGFLYVVDRKKEIFKYYNYHISPSDLENIISQHRYVREVCVVGVPDPGGDVPRAFVIIRRDQSHNLPSDSDMTKEIIEFTNAKVPDYKRLRGGLYILPELPKGKTGKITRSLVAQIKV